MILQPTANKRMVFFIFLDIVISLGTLLLSYQLRFNFDVPAMFYDSFIKVFLSVIILKITFIGLFNIYKVSWRFFSLYEAKKLFHAHLITYSILGLFVYFQSDLFYPIPRSVIIIDFFLSLIFIGLLRVLKRLLIESGTDSNLNRTLLIGANSFSHSLIKENKKYYIVAVVDTASNIIGTFISNIKVYNMDHLSEVIKENEVNSVIITKEFSQNELQTIYNKLAELNITDIKLAVLSEKEKKLKDLSVEDLLARHPKDLDKNKIELFIKNKTILVTGAGGSIGSEICRQVALFEAKQIILVDHSEYNLYQITEELKSYNIVSVMQSVRNSDFLENTFKKYNPDIVIHAAAYKHVPLCEDNISEAISNNIIGTKNCIDLSIKYNVEKFILISTDKAVRPTNVMGTTKRICELYASNVNSQFTEIVAVRFGNVLGSSGSVIPKFKSQIENGEAITVTHPDITRYFMLIPEACELVLQAGSLGCGGEIFILDMGEPIKIVDLAKKMIELSGKENISIVFSGLRPGEKLYEELLIDESDSHTEYDSITVARPTFYEIQELKEDIQELLICENKLTQLKKIVPEFNHQPN